MTAGPTGTVACVEGLVERIWRFERDRRFWRHVDVRARDECWPWASGDSHVAGADMRAYELVRGPLPKGASLRHRCGTRACVNPDHMDVVPHRFASDRRQ